MMTLTLASNGNPISIAVETVAAISPGPDGTIVNLKPAGERAIGVKESYKKVMKQYRYHSKKS